jgi:adhesin/invasin
MRIRFSGLRALAGIALLGTLGGCIFTSPDIPAFLKNTAGSNQVVAPNAPAPAPLTVTVRDQDGNPMENITVEWFIKSGSGTLSAAQSTTNGDGQASVSYTAGASTGNTTIIAEVPELGAAVAFILVVK